MTVDTHTAAVADGAVIDYATPHDDALPPRPDGKSDVPRTFARQALIDTFSAIGARVGAAWILLLLLASVFAPLIATSFPLLAKENGHWSSPAIRFMQSADLVWLGAFLLGVVLLITRAVTFWNAILAIVWFIALLVPLTLWPAVRGGWRPGAEALGNSFGISVLIVVGLGCLGILVAAPLLSSVRLPVNIAMGCVAVVVTILFIAFPVQPSAAPIYETYRERKAAGLIQYELNAVVPFSPNDYQRDVDDPRLKPPSAQHWMGTEQSGSDVFSRMLHASRIALSVGFIATGVAVIIGIVVGGVMGYFAGSVDMIGMRLIEIFEAIPSLILLLTVAAFFGRNLYLMMLIIGLLSWTGYARFIRADFLTLRDRDFVHAAIASGLPTRSIIFRHMLPNGLTAVLVNTSFGVASAILTEAVLSFLGLGLVDEPSWGQLLNQVRAGGTGFQWWIATFPGLAIFLTVFAYNLIGEAMRDALDPSLRKRE